MAYEALDVTAVAANIITSPFYWKATPHSVEITRADFDFEADGWTQLGYAGTDGLDNEQAADQNDKRVWSKSLGSSYSNFTDRLTVRLASVLDADVLAAAFGAEAVTVNGTDGTITLKIKGRTPTQGAFAFQGFSDSGRAMLLVVHRAQPDVNISRTWSEEDITVIEMTFDCIYDTAVDATHYEVYEPVGGYED